MRRNRSFDELVSGRMRSLEYRQGYLLACMEGDDGVDLEDALRDTIRRMGIKEFAKLAKVPGPNVAQFLSGKRRLKPETLDKYLKPFGLKTQIIAVKAA